MAAAADAFADLIVNFDADQASYLTRPTVPFFYAYPDEAMHFNPEKFVDPRVPVVLHAPSKRLIKGTAFVREAVSRLQSEGFSFEYVELTGVSNRKVLEQLSRAHIVLNQFWALVPGVFGVEAMANTCAMMCSADGTIEHGLPDGANDAWLVTTTDQVYENLKVLLTDWTFTTALAVRGFNWLATHETFSVNAPEFQRKLNLLFEQ